MVVSSWFACEKLWFSSAQPVGQRVYHHFHTCSIDFPSEIPWNHHEISIINQPKSLPAGVVLHARSRQDWGETESSRSSGQSPKSMEMFLLELWEQYGNSAGNEEFPDFLKIRESSCAGQGERATAGKKDTWLTWHTACTMAHDIMIIYIYTHLYVCIIEFYCFAYTHIEIEMWYIGDRLNYRSYCMVYTVFRTYCRHHIQSKLPPSAQFLLDFFWKESKEEGQRERRSQEKERREVSFLQFELWTVDVEDSLTLLNCNQSDLSTKKIEASQKGQERPRRVGEVCQLALDAGWTHPSWPRRCACQVVCLGLSQIGVYHGPKSVGK